MKPSGPTYVGLGEGGKEVCVCVCVHACMR